MSIDRFAKLTPRHRACLRLVFDRKRTKEIATILGISTGTVSSYCAEAIRVLGARDRIDAAEMLAKYEGAATPTILGEPFEWVDPEPDRKPSPGEEADSAIPRSLPLRQGVRGNDLGIIGRMCWVFILALAVAVGFGTLATGVRATSDIIAGRTASR
jgi:DNA-binding CsgD family transcriptional regulator